VAGAGTFGATACFFSRRIGVFIGSPDLFALLL
jgi:hypothetical protein